MQELEEILEEIEQRVNYYKEHATLEYVDICAGLREAEGIIRNHMNDVWVSVEERLPMRTSDEKINESYQKYLVFIDGVDGWDIDIAVYDFWNDKKWREAHDGYGEIENVNAWRPLPEAYLPERNG